ncbi:hypothetical protein HY493_02435, partial [Candidatus Woesearchaeota archaeon]|nr:hypothetical protein [Candidatus Woesearchaeota archaeon]
AGLRNVFRRDDGGINIAHMTGWRLAAEAMGIDWMNRDELIQAIPPVYSEHVGKALLTEVYRTLSTQMDKEDA